MKGTKAKCVKWVSYCAKLIAATWVGPGAWDRQGRTNSTTHA